MNLAILINFIFGEHLNLFIQPFFNRYIFQKEGCADLDQVNLNIGYLILHLLQCIYKTSMARLLFI